MFDQLDTALSNLLNDTAMHAVLPELLNAEISFLTPDKDFAPDKDTVSLFLYETKENRELRNAPPLTQTINGMGQRRRQPLRVDCAYMVTTWSKKRSIDKVTAEHQLLGQAYNWLSRFPVLPLSFFKNSARPGQLYDPPTLVAQMDGAKSAGEFWHALSIAPRPYFNLMVTLTMDLDQGFDDSLVTTISGRYRADDPASMEERLIVSGTARDRHGNALADAWVRLEPTGETAVTNGLGQFVFSRATRGAGYTLRARSQGLIDAQRLNVEVPSPSGEYDIHFT